MSVYFIAAGGYIKIGCSEDAQRRFERLHRSGTAATFPPGVSTALADRRLLRVVSGWLTEETAVHRALDEFSVGLEWFLDEPPVREFIASLPDKCPAHLPRVTRPGGWCEREYDLVHAGRAEREYAAWLRRRSA